MGEVIGRYRGHFCWFGKWRDCDEKTGKVETKTLSLEVPDFPGRVIFIVTECDGTDKNGLTAVLTKGVTNMTVMGGGISGKDILTKRHKSQRSGRARKER